MIARLTSDQLRKMADQLDAWTMLTKSGGIHPPVNSSIVVHDKNGKPVRAAYIYWWEDERRFMAEIPSFRPQSELPLIWHSDDNRKEV